MPKGNLLFATALTGKFRRDNYRVGSLNASFAIPWGVTYRVPGAAKTVSHR
jgi:hypothetical protein